MVYFDKISLILSALINLFKEKYLYSKKGVLMCII
jgi:hypothetical protein